MTDDSFKFILNTATTWDYMIYTAKKIGDDMFDISYDLDGENHVMYQEGIVRKYLLANQWIIIDHQKSCVDINELLRKTERALYDNLYNNSLTSQGIEIIKNMKRIIDEILPMQVEGGNQ